MLSSKYLRSLLFYRPRSEGDNVIGSVRPSVRPSVCVFAETITSLRYLSVSVNVGRVRLISRMRSIGF